MGPSPPCFKALGNVTFPVENQLQLQIIDQSNGFLHIYIIYMIKSVYDLKLVMSQLSLNLKKKQFYDY